MPVVTFLLFGAIGTIRTGTIIVGLLQYAETIARPYREGADLWVALGTILTAIFTLVLAAGTFALARFTYLSVQASSVLARGDDVRHQQNLGPILSIEPILQGDDFNGFRIHNVGLGPAQNVTLMIKGSLFAAPATGLLAKDIELFKTRTILEARENTSWTLLTQEESEFQRLAWLPKTAARLVIVLSYFDLTGNEYRTLTTDPVDAAQMAWLRPARLYPDRTRIESYLDKHATAEQLFEALSPSRLVATTG